MLAHLKSTLYVYITSTKLFYLIAFLCKDGKGISSVCTNTHTSDLIAHEKQRNQSNPCRQVLDNKTMDISCALPLLDKEGQKLTPWQYALNNEHVYGESNLISHHIDFIPQFTFQIFLCSQSLEPTNDLIDCECLWSKQFWLALQPSALGWLQILQNTEHAFSLNV